MMSLYTATMTLILVMDPLGNIPVFLSTLKKVDSLRRKFIIVRETFIAFIILTGFLFFGKHVLAWMQISEPALGVAGGILLFLIALEMIFPSNTQNVVLDKTGEPFIVPLAIPLIAGPSTIAVVMLLASQAPQHSYLWMLALSIAWLVCTLVLVCSDMLCTILGDKVLMAIERLMGMILTTMAVQMFLSGIKLFFNL